MSQITQLAENVLALTDVEAVRNRSWRPPGTTGYEPFNKYLFLADDRALLLDTGPRAHRDSLIATLGEIVGSRHLTCMVSRSEPDSITNVGAVVDRFPDLRVVGIMKNLPFLGLVEMEKTPREGLVAERVALDRPLVDYGFPQLTPVEPIVKTLSTIWIRDDYRNLLFTSDSFSADLFATPDDDVIRRSGEGHPGIETVRAHAFAKFDWLEHAWVHAHSRAWDRFFASFRPEVLAPGLGKLQAGRMHVEKLLEIYRAALFGVQSPPYDRVPSRSRATSGG